MRRDKFLRCYLEAWVYWIGLNLLGALIGRISNSLFELPTIPPSQISLLFDPVALIAQGVIIIPLFAAILVGSRRSTGRAD